MLSRDSTHAGAMVRYGRILEDLAHEHQVCMYVRNKRVCMCIYICVCVCVHMCAMVTYGTILEDLVHGHQECVYVSLPWCMCM